MLIVTCMNTNQLCIYDREVKEKKSHRIITRVRIYQSVAQAYQKYFYVNTKMERESTEIKKRKEFVP